MKKQGIGTILLVAAGVLTIAGCGSNSEDVADAATPATSAVEATTSSATSAPKSAESSEAKQQADASSGCRDLVKINVSGGEPTWISEEVSRPPTRAAYDWQVKGIVSAGGARSQYACGAAELGSTGVLDMTLISVMPAR